MGDVTSLYWVSPHPNHYHSYLLDNIRRVEGLSVYPVYVNSKLLLYPWSSVFIKHPDSYIINRRFGIDFRFIGKVLLQNKSLIVIAGWNDITCFTLITVLAVLKRRFILYSDTPRTDVERRGTKQLLRKLWLNIVYQRMWKHFVTGEVGVEALKSMGAPKRKIINFPFATNVDFFVPPSSRVMNSKMIFFSSGRLDIKHKGYDVIIEALGILRTSDPALKFNYLIAGTGPDEELIRRQIEALNLSDSVTLLGWLEPDQLLNYYQKSDFFIHPSNFDPYPNSVLEAMSCGLPVIGSDLAGSVRDRVEDGINGFIFRAGNVNDLLTALRLSFNTTLEDRNKMGAHCRLISQKWQVAYHVKIIKGLIQPHAKN
jgi:glycosyltransferase involved in cell wall biosynthesis